MNRYQRFVKNTVIGGMACIAGGVIYTVMTALPQGALADWTNYPGDTPSSKRGFEVRTSDWTDGDRYVIVNAGNWIEIWRDSDKRFVEREELACASGCPVSIIGDTDFQIKGLAACDGCRYMVAAGRDGGAALIDFGTGAHPSVTNKRLLDAQSDRVVTFEFMGQQYLVMTQPTGARHAQVWRIDDFYTLTMVADLGVVGTFTNSVMWHGRVFMTQAPSYSIFELDPTTWGLTSTGLLSTPFGLDLSGDYLLTTAGGVAQIWSLPARTLVHTVSFPTTVTSATLDYPLVWAAQYMGTESFIHDVSTGSTVTMDSTIWQDGTPKFDGHAAHAQFYDDTLYFTDFSSVEWVNVESGCGIFDDDFESGDTSKWSAKSGEGAN